ncbi:uncharacterized protein LOC106760322 [Vigna radiata var. radiata]|uniref:Uncharacterized protein LOC106760322 n=1 Tax=Vigna radiata var. radiata TaxID=3916 RepID=A0A1S3TZR0_VIGRR|nr:uncharacterized protein LOC106760322 [Vigna radiata var. radiata]
MVTTRNTSAEDQTEVMRLMEQRMMEMQRKHEEEMAAVRAECLAQITKSKSGVAGGEQGEGAGEKQIPLEGENSSARAEGREEKVNKEDSRLLVKVEESTVLVSFVREIMEVHISEQFMPPQFKMYDGTSDPIAHVKSFINAMTFRTGCDAIWCRAFSLSLEGEALEWFNSLPVNSIENFKSLGEMFKKQFAACNMEDVTVVDLMNLKQGKEEPLKTFMDRYQKTVRRVKGLGLELALQYVMPALRPGPFKDSICRNPPRTMEELRQRATDETRVENMKQQYQKEVQEARADKTDGKRTKGQANRQNGQKGREGPRGPRFQQYTTLNTPRVRILQEALNTQIMQTPLRRPTPPGADLTKHCLYHKNSSHDTEECVTLRDKIEELVRVGRLQQYVKANVTDQYPDRLPSPRLRSPPRRSYRPRSPRRQERDANVRNHRPSQDNKRERRSRSHSREGDRRRPLRGVINTISGGFAGGGSTSSARKRSIRALRSIHVVDVPKRTMPPITFTDEDFHAPDPDQDDPMVITVEIAQYGVSKVLVD